MFRRANKSDAQFKLDALDRSLATIEFDMDGLIQNANQNFLTDVGYAREEILGKHHRIFVDGGVAASADYTNFWARLRKGEFVSGEFLRIAKDGSRIWLEATYNPILDMHGKPVKVMKFASNITNKKNEIDRLMTMIDKMPVAVMTADMKDNVITHPGNREVQAPTVLRIVPKGVVPVRRAVSTTVRMSASPSAAHIAR